MHLPIERKVLILEKLKIEKIIRISDICKLFKISRATALSDLRELEKENKILKVHGGALLPNDLSLEKSIKQTMVENLNAKRKIGIKAAEFVNDKDIIILGSGSTISEMVKHLINKKKLTIITNSIITAYLLFEYNDYNNFDIYITGGYLRKKSGSLVGWIADNTLKEFNVNKAFCSSSGINLNGITDINPEESVTYRTLFSRAKEKYILIDSTKYEKKFFFNILPLEKIDCIITEKNVGKKYLDFFKKKKIKFVVA